MLNRQAISKIRKELEGLDNWPMSSSYPQDSGEREFKEIMRTFRTETTSDGKYKGWNGITEQEHPLFITLLLISFQVFKQM